VWPLLARVGPASRTQLAEVRIAIDQQVVEYPASHTLGHHDAETRIGRTRVGHVPSHPGHPQRLHDVRELASRLRIDRSGRMSLHDQGANIVDAEEHRGRQACEACADHQHREPLFRHEYSLRTAFVDSNTVLRSNSVRVKYSLRHR
jgi:hypothetical protein